MGISFAKVTQATACRQGVEPAVQVESRRSEGAALQANGDPVFFAAGLVAPGEYQCIDCGYGIAVRRVLPECPMCRGVQWEERGTSPYGRSSL